MDYRTEIAEKLLQIKAINLNIDKSFVWASGINSPIYCDNRVTLSDIETRELICNGFVAMSEKMQPFDVIGGVATGGIAHGMLLADRLKKPFIYMRTSAKGHGLKNAVEGRLIPGQRVLVIEDLISTGGSSYQAIEAVRESGGVIAGMIAIFTYGFESAKNLFQINGIKVETLTDYETLIPIAVERGFVGSQHVDTLKEWRMHPEKWRR